MADPQTVLGPILAEISALRAEVRALAPADPPALQTEPASGGLHDEEIRAVQIEIAQLVKSIAKAKAEIAAIKHPKAEDDRLVEASNELDAIVTATERATTTILDSAEAIEREAASLAAQRDGDPEVVEAAQRIVEQVVQILEASNFQDVTGQRISKVVQTVRFIEERILSMIHIWGVSAFEDLPVPAGGSADPDDEASLLNGPQMENQGISQADIDALFD
jgi:chemotaxis protein CheZ